MTYEDPAVDVRDLWYRLRLVGRDGSEAFTAPVQVAATNRRTVLGPAFVSARNGPVRIHYSLASKEERVSLEVFDVTGRRVVVGYQGQGSPGDHVANWNRHDSSGRRGVPRGVYLVRLSTAEERLSTKLLLAPR